MKKDGLMDVVGGFYEVNIPSFLAAMLDRCNWHGRGIRGGGKAWRLGIGFQKLPKLGNCKVNEWRQYAHRIWLL